MKQLSGPKPQPSRQPAAAAPADPVDSLKNKVTGTVVGFVRRNPWKTAAMVAAAGLVFALCGGNSKAKA